MNEEGRGEKGSREGKREVAEREWGDERKGGKGGGRGKEGGKWEEEGSLMVGSRARERKNFNQISITSIPLFWRFSNSISCVRE